MNKVKINSTGAHSDEKKKKNENSSKIFEYHDHGACFGDAITQIEDYFIQKKLQLTPLRRKVFEILIEDHKPLGAYDILDKLGEAGFSSSPPIAYRVLDFLIEHGFVHKVQGLNAFIACSTQNTRIFLLLLSVENVRK